MEASPVGEARTATTSADGCFSVFYQGQGLLFVAGLRLAWTAEFGGDAAHNGSSDSGVFGVSLVM